MNLSLKDFFCMKLCATDVNGIKLSTQFCVSWSALRLKSEFSLAATQVQRKLRNYVLIFGKLPLQFRQIFFVKLWFNRKMLLLPPSCHNLHILIVLL